MAETKPVRYVNDFMLRIEGPPLRELSSWGFAIYDAEGREVRCGPVVTLPLLGTAVLPSRVADAEKECGQC